MDIEEDNIEEDNIEEDNIEEDNIEELEEINIEEIEDDVVDSDSEQESKERIEIDEDEAEEYRQFLEFKKNKERFKNAHIQFDAPPATPQRKHKQFIVNLTSNPISIPGIGSYVGKVKEKMIKLGVVGFGYGAGVYNIGSIPDEELDGNDSYCYLIKRNFIKEITEEERDNILAKAERKIEEYVRNNGYDLDTDDAYEISKIISSKTKRVIAPNKDINNMRSSDFISHIDMGRSGSRISGDGFKIGNEHYQSYKTMQDFYNSGERRR